MQYDGSEMNEEGSSSGEFGLEIEFSRSFEAKISPSLKSNLTNIHRLRNLLKKQIEKCSKDVKKDLRKFDKSLALGKRMPSAVDISSKETRTVLTNELQNL